MPDDYEFVQKETAPLTLAETARYYVVVTIIMSVFTEHLLCTKLYARECGQVRPKKQPKEEILAPLRTGFFPS